MEDRFVMGAENELRPRPRDEVAECVNNHETVPFGI